MKKLFTYLLILMVSITVGCDTMTSIAEVAQKKARRFVPEEVQDHQTRKQITEFQTDVAKQAASIEVEILPRYAQWLGSTDFTTVKENDFGIFRDMISEFRFTRSQLMLASTLGTSLKEMDRLIKQAEEDLHRMQVVAQNLDEVSTLNTRLEDGISSRERRKMFAKQDDHSSVQAVEYIERLELEQRASEIIEATGYSTPNVPSSEELAALREEALLSTAQKNRF